MKGKILTIPLLLLIVLASGCITPEQIVMNHPIVKDFLAEYPDAEVKITHFTAVQAENVIESIRENCGNPYLEAKDYYKIIIEDKESGLSVLAWVDWENKIVECATKRGNEDTAPLVITITNPSDNSVVKTNSVSVEATTNENAVCNSRLTVLTGEGAGQTNWQQMPTTGTTSHSQLIENLKDKYSYNIELDCTDDSDNTGSGSIEFTVELAAEDIVPPTITITQPEDGSTVTTSSITLGATTDENTVCKSRLTVFTGGGAGQTIWKQMNNTGGTQHSQSLTNLGDGNQYTIELNCTDNSGNSNTVSVIFGVSLPESDLTVTDINYTPASPKVDDIIMMSATISNIGEGVASGSVEFKCEIAYPSGEKRAGGGSCGATIAPGHSKTCGTCGYPLTEEGDYTLTFVVDPDNKIAESDETNNDYSKTISVSPSAKPDMIISSVSPDSGILNINDTVDFSVTVTNNGEGNFNGFVTVKMKMTFPLGSPVIDGGSTYEGSDKVVDLPPGTSETYTFNSITLLYEGDYIFDFIVDPLNKREESNESNNEYSIIVSVSP